MESKINKLVKSRRATPPKFLSKKEIAKETIEQILENANWAPTHKQTEPWRFKVYRGEARVEVASSIYETLQRNLDAGAQLNMQKAVKLKATFSHVPVVIAIVFQRDAAQRIPEWEEISAVAMAVQNMWLTATDLGLGAFWASPDFLPLLHENFELETSQKLLGFFYLGEIAMDYPSPGRGPISEKVVWKG